MSSTPPRAALIHTCYQITPESIPVWTPARVVTSPKRHGSGDKRWQGTFSKAKVVRSRVMRWESEQGAVSPDTSTLQSHQGLFFSRYKSLESKKTMTAVSTIKKAGPISGGSWLTGRILRTARHFQADGRRGYYKKLQIIKPG